MCRKELVATYVGPKIWHLHEALQVEVPSDEVKNAVFDPFDRDDNNVVAARHGFSMLFDASEAQGVAFLRI